MSYRVLLAFFSITLFMSCSKDNPNTNDNSVPTQGDIMMNVDGYAWAAPQGYATKSGTAVLTMYGQANQNSTVNLVISPYNQPQSYQLNGITKITYYENNVEYQSINGQITVSSEDDYHIEGTFNAEVLSNSGGISLSITNGRFNISK